jgi:hypothetical protein
MDFPEIVLDLPRAEAPPFDATSFVIDAPQPTGQGAVATVREHALAPLSKVALGIAQLKADHGSTAYDITTPHGMTLAKARRHAIRLVRYEVPKVVKEKRAELDELKKDISAEGDRIVAELLAIEKPHDDLITAEEERRAEEKRKAAEAKAAAERAEAERKQRHADALAKIRNYLALASAPGMTAERIGKGIALLEAVATGPEWEEFAGQAADTKAATLASMRELHAKAVAAEAEAARIEAQRVENERLAAALAEQQRQLAEREAALKKAEEDAAARARAEEERQAAEKRRAEEAAAAQAAAEAAATEAAAQAERERQARATAPVDDDTGEILVPAAKPATVPVSTPATATTAQAPLPTRVMTIPQLQFRLEMPVPEQLLTRLGFKPPLLTADFPAICDALIAHITTKKGA